MQAGILITCKKWAFIQTKGELLRVKLKTWFMIVLLNSHIMSTVEGGIYCAYCLSGNQGDNRKNLTCVSNGKMPPDFDFEFHV